MNYLAHLYLAKDSDELIVGNFIGDFVKGKLKDQFPAPIMRGIVLHRKIDSYTDSHAATKRSRKLVSVERRKYAGVLIDIFFDHFLSLKWDDYSDVPLPEFTSRVCRSLEKYEDLLPEDAGKLLPAIRDRNWLGRYRNVDDLKGVFTGLSRRVRRENPLPGSEQELIANYRSFEANFDIFFPQLIEYTDNIKRDI